MNTPFLKGTRIQMEFRVWVWLQDKSRILVLKAKCAN